MVDGSADLGVIGYFQPADRLQVRPYRRVPLMLVVPPAHPLAGRNEIRFAEILEFDLDLNLIFKEDRSDALGLAQLIAHLCGN